MYGTPLSNTLSFSKVLSGLSKTLTVANQVIPLYKQAKPLINNLSSVRTILSSLTKNDSNSSNNSTTANKKTNNQISSHNEENISILNPPTFFR